MSRVRDSAIGEIRERHLVCRRTSAAGRRSSRSAARRTDGRPAVSRGPRAPGLGSRPASPTRRRAARARARCPDACRRRHLRRRATWRLRGSRRRSLRSDRNSRIGSRMRCSAASSRARRSRIGTPSSLAPPYASRASRPWQIRRGRTQRAHWIRMFFTAATSRGTVGLVHGRHDRPPGKWHHGLSKAVRHPSRADPDVVRANLSAPAGSAVLVGRTPPRLAARAPREAAVSGAIVPTL